MFLGICFILISSLCFSLVFVCVKASDGIFSLYQVAFIRGIVNAILAFSYLKFLKVEIVLKRPLGIYIRCVAGLISMLFYFKSLRVLTLSDAVTINSTTPLFMTILLILFGVPRPKKTSWFLVMIGFVGVVILLKPEMGFLNQNAVWGLIAVIFLTVVFTALHHISRTYHPEQIVLYFSTFICITMLPFVSTFSMPKNALEWCILLGIGVLGSIGQALFTRGLKLVPLIIASQAINLTILISISFGLFFFKEHLSYNYFVGFGLIVLACSWLYGQNRKEQSRIKWEKIYRILHISIKKNRRKKARKKAMKKRDIVADSGQIDVIDL